MNILQQISFLQRKIACMEYGIRILHIGTNLPYSNKRNTVQVRSNGETYLIDRDGKMLRLSGIAPIEVIIGSQTAIKLGFLNGGTSLIYDDFINKNLEIFIGNINVLSIDKGDGTPWFSKDLDSNVVVLHLIALATGDVLKIKFLS